MNIGHTSMDFKNDGTCQVELTLVSADLDTLKNFVSHLCEEGDSKPIVCDFTGDVFGQHTSKKNNLAEVHCYFSVEDSEALVHWLLQVAHTWEIAFEMWSASVGMHKQEYAHSNHKGTIASYIRKEWNVDVIEGENDGFKNFKRVKNIY